MPWHYGSGRRALKRGGGRAGPAVFSGCGAYRFFVDIWGLAAKEWNSLVPVHTSSSIFCEKRNKWSGVDVGVSGGCDMLSWLPWLFSRKSSLGAVLERL